MSVPGSEFLRDTTAIADPARPGRYELDLSHDWVVTEVPQGGVVAAVAARAMAASLDHRDQVLRSISAVFAGLVRPGPVEVEVTVLRRGRSLSQLAATVRNVGAEAGLTALAVFGATLTGVRVHRCELPRGGAARGVPFVSRPTARRRAREPYVGVPLLVTSGGPARSWPCPLGPVAAHHVRDGRLVPLRRPADRRGGSPRPPGPGRPQRHHAQLGGRANGRHRCRMVRAQCRSDRPRGRGGPPADGCWPVAGLAMPARDTHRSSSSSGTRPGRRWWPTAPSRCTFNSSVTRRPVSNDGPGRPFPLPPEPCPHQKRCRNSATCSARDGAGGPPGLSKREQPGAVSSRPAAFARWRRDRRRPTASTRPPCP